MYMCVNVYVYVYVYTCICVNDSTVAFSLYIQYLGEVGKRDYCIVHGLNLTRSVCYAIPYMRNFYT